MSGTTIDLFKENRDEYRTPKHPTLMVIGPALYIAVEGQGAPETHVFAQKREALLLAAQTITQALQSGGRDYRLGHLQCQWWSDEAHELNFQEALPRYWCFRLLIRVPDLLDNEFLKSTVQSYPDPAWYERLGQVGLLKLDEGLVLQLLHTGEVAHIGRTTKRMREFARKNHLHFAAPHHEIYLPEGYGLAGPHGRTIVRRPVR